MSQRSSFDESAEVHRKSMEAVDRLLKETPKEELDKLFAEVDANVDPNGVTVEQYFDGFEYEYQRWWKSLADQ